MEEVNEENVQKAVSFDPVYPTTEKLSQNFSCGVDGNGCSWEARLGLSTA